MSEPVNPKGVTINGIEARPTDIRPSEHRGETTTLEVLVEPVDDSDTYHETQRYQQLKAYQRYAGEADFGQLLGGRPHLREHPIDDWSVDSHVVDVRYGSEIAVDSGFWGLVTSVDDSETAILGQTDAAGVTYGELDYGVGPYGGEYSADSPNYYRLTIELVQLADLWEYKTRSVLLDDLSPELTQL